MTGIPVALDANLLLLLVVGFASKRYIPMHKRLRSFTIDDYDLLRNELEAAAEIVVTPNTLTETSNLIDHIADPARTHVYETMRGLLTSTSTTETFIPSSKASARSEFVRLGLADCGLLELCSSGTPLMTVDVHLYLAAVATGSKALNFNHIRNERL